MFTLVFMFSNTHSPSSELLLHSLCTAHTRFVFTNTHSHDTSRYARIPFEAINSSEHWSSSLNAARQTHVLLTNCDRVTDRCVNASNPPMGSETLPLSPGGRIAVIGPHATSRVALVGNYFEYGGNDPSKGIPSGLCPDPANPDSCVATLTGA